MRTVPTCALLVALGVAIVNCSLPTQTLAASAPTEGPLKAVVVSVSPIELTVKGEASAARTMHVFVKGAKVTKGGWKPATLKDIHKGDSVTITFAAAAQGRGRLVAAQIDLAGEPSTDGQAAVLGKPGKLLFEDDFERSAMTPNWRPGKGEWNIDKGVVVAAENPADAHAAYAHMNPAPAYKDMIAEFSFKFVGATNCSFMMDDKNYKEAHAGHIIRATITPNSVNLGDSKFGSMRNDIFEKMKSPSTTPEERAQLQASIKDKAATFKVALESDVWHRARLEVVGDEMLLSIDNRPVGYFKSEGVNHPTKNSTGFQVGGKFLHIDNVKLWEATPRDDWSANRAAVQALIQKP